MKILLQYLLPQHLLSKFAGFLAESNNIFLKSFLIARFMKKYPINLQEAEQENPNQYKTFSEFFTRRLKKTARPINQDPAVIISPADGYVAQLGTISAGKLIQAKGHEFKLKDLLGDNAELTATFDNGNFITIYLAPHNYHRVHVPYDATLISSFFIPGRLFSVNTLTAQTIPELYSRNERLICLFETELGKMAVIFVGAIIVGSIQLSFQDKPARSKEPLLSSFNPPFSFKKGDELGLFKLGSTVIVLFERNKIAFSKSLAPNDALKIGEPIATIEGS